jgi:hypothetical protein
MIPRLQHIFCPVNDACQHIIIINFLFKEGFNLSFLLLSKIVRLKFHFSKPLSRGPVCTYPNSYQLVNIHTKARIYLQ